MSGYAAFAAMHRERLVRSLVAETGLPRARAQAVAAEVLAAAWERGVTFPDGAAYGWLRVAARHRAADPAAGPASDWAAAADAAVAHAHDAVAALADLPPAERELLRLRYVEGLLPAAIADRLGTTVAEVRQRLDRAMTGATRRLTRRRTVAPYVRPSLAALLVAAAAVSLVGTTSHQGSRRPPTAAGVPSYGGAPLALDPVDAASSSVHPVTVAAVPPHVSEPVSVSPDDADDSSSAGHGCGLTCGVPDSDQVVIVVPAQLTAVLGDEIARPVPTGFCHTFPMPAPTVAQCVSGGHRSLG